MDPHTFVGTSVHRHHFVNIFSFIQPSPTSFPSSAALVNSSGLHAPEKGVFEMSILRQISSDPILPGSVLEIPLGLIIFPIIISLEFGVARLGIAFHPVRVIGLLI